jgi:hypothetical protein
LSDKQFTVFQQLGGADWFRELLEKKAPFPASYYKKLLEKTNVTNND